MHFFISASQLLFSTTTNHTERLCSEVVKIEERLETWYLPRGNYPAGVKKYRVY
jgi:hypothetical protein